MGCVHCKGIVRHLQTYPDSLPGSVSKCICFIAVDALVDPRCARLRRDRVAGFSFQGMSAELRADSAEVRSQKLRSVIFTA